MQINPSHNLPIIRSQQTEPVNTRPRQPVARPTAENPPHRYEQNTRQQTNRRKPVFLQPTNHAVSRTGAQAMHAYQDTAMAGNREELVNRIHETV